MSSGAKESIEQEMETTHKVSGLVWDGQEKKMFENRQRESARNQGVKRLEESIGTESLPRRQQVTWDGLYKLDIFLPIGRLSSTLL
jgi:hypothetical protein